MFSEPKFWKLRNTYFVNRIYGFIRTRRSKSKCTKFNYIYKKITFWSPFSSWNWGCLWNKLAWEVISLKHRDFHRRVKIFWSLYISEISGTRFNAGITFPTSLCQYLLPLPSGLDATFLSLGFHIGLGLSSSPLDCDLLMSMDAVAFPLAPAGPSTVLFNKRLLYWSVKEHILLLPLEAW